MSITDRTRKLLWARSGNRCAFCRRVLIEEATSVDRESIVGDECHIYPQNGGGRAVGEPPDDIDDYSNLVLLCKIHHKQVDDQPLFFTMERLHVLKSAHETWVHTTLEDSVAGPRFLRLIRWLWARRNAPLNPPVERVGEYQRGLGQRHRFLREAVLELDLRTMADVYGFGTVAQLERYEAGVDEFPQATLALLRQTFFVRDEYIRGTSPFIFDSLVIEQKQRIHELLDAGFSLYFLCSPGDRHDLLTYPYLHKAEGEISRGLIANRLSSFSPTAGGGAINIFQVISVMIDRGMEWTDATALTVRDYQWEWLQSGRFQMSKYGPAAHWVDRECQERWRQMFNEAQTDRAEFYSNGLRSQE